VYYLTEEGQAGFMPAVWTDVGPKDPFVEQACGRTLARTEDFWKQNKIYVNSRFLNEDIMKHDIIMSIGISGREEALDWYRSFRNKSEDKINYSAVVSGVFHYRMVKSYGLEYFIDNILAFSNDIYVYMKYYAAWAETPEGKDWRAWCGKY
jgi:hypothetical protein